MFGCSFRVVRTCCIAIRVPLGSRKLHSQQRIFILFVATNHVMPTVAHRILLLLITKQNQFLCSTMHTRYGALHEVFAFSHASLAISFWSPLHFANYA